VIVAARVIGTETEATIAETQCKVEPAPVCEAQAVKQELTECRQELKKWPEPGSEAGTKARVEYLLAEWAARLGVNYQLAHAIISCEGGFTNPKRCNESIGCTGGQGHYQIIPSTWAGIIADTSNPLPDYCRKADAVFISECNIAGGTWLLKRDGDRHWQPYSGWCYAVKL